MGEEMGEETWLATDSFQALWPWAENGLKKLRRKQRLFCVACCRRLGRLLTDPRSVAAIDAAERYADGQLGKTTLWKIRRQALDAAEDSRWGRKGNWTPAEAAENAASGDRSEVFVTGPIRVTFAVADAEVRSKAEEDAFQADLLREIFGNPFRPVAFSPSWRTDTAVSLAKQMYESRDFSLMPILADALQDAGCDDEEMLDHCRDADAPHVRGCWVVDLVLGKE